MRAEADLVSEGLEIEDTIEADDTEDRDEDEEEASEEDGEIGEDGDALDLDSSFEGLTMSSFKTKVGRRLICD